MILHIETSVARRLQYQDFGASSALPVVSNPSQYEQVTARDIGSTTSDIQPCIRAGPFCETQAERGCQIPQQIKA